MGIPSLVNYTPQGISLAITLAAPLLAATLPIFKAFTKQAKEFNSSIKEFEDKERELSYEIIHQVAKKQEAERKELIDKELKHLKILEEFADRTRKFHFTTQKWFIAAFTADVISILLYHSKLESLANLTLALTIIGIVIIIPRTLSYYMRLHQYNTGTYNPYRAFEFYKKEKQGRFGIETTDIMF